MAQMSNFLRDSLVNHVFRNSTMSTPGNVYIALYSTDPTTADTGVEISGNGYARQQVTFGSPVDGIASNTAEIVFPAATADWTTVTHVGIRSEATGGNLLMPKQLVTPVDILSGNTFRIPTSDLEIIFS